MGFAPAQFDTASISLKRIAAGPGISGLPGWRSGKKLPAGALPLPFPGLSPVSPGLDWEHLGGSGPGKVIDKKRPKKIVIIKLVLILS